jgi:hypothetical protein
MTTQGKDSAPPPPPGQIAGAKAPVPGDQFVPDADSKPQYDEIQHEDVVREHFGWALFVFLAGITVAAIGLDLNDHVAWVGIRGLITTLVTSLLTLLATVIGYYYGSRK